MSAGPLPLLRRLALDLALTLDGAWSGNLLLFGSIAAAAGLAFAAARSRPAPVGFSLAALGERERPDGSWEGADLLRDSTPSVDRFQLTLSPDDDVRLLLESRSADGSWERLYLGTLSAHRDYALPGPNAFFGVQGDARVRLTVSSPRDPAEAPSPALAGEVAQGALPLSDGAPFRATRVRFSAARAGIVELPVHGR